MTQISADPPSPDTSSTLDRITSYIFDVRFLGVLGQMAFIAFVIFAFNTLFTNFSGNAEKLGDAQFICRDGRIAYRCAYDFMANEAGFDVSDAPLGYVNTDSYWWALANGIANTFRVGVLALIATTILGTLAGIARLSDNWLVSKVALAYVEIIRNTPILVQLLLIYFSVILALPQVEDALKLPGLPVFLSGRGLSMPWPKMMSSAPIWLAFIVLGIIQYQVLMMYFRRREELTGRSDNRYFWSIVSFLAIAVIGWGVAGAVADREALLTTAATRIEEFRDIEKVMITRGGVNYLEDFETMSEEEVAAAALQICVQRDTVSEPNLTNRLVDLGVPYEIRRLSSAEKMRNAYADGKCEMIADSKDTIAAIVATLDSPTAHNVVEMDEQPFVWSIPRFEGFNILGGFKMTGEFFALFLGLTIFYGGGLAEVVRAGILSVSKGQTEASRALGLSEGQRLQLIVLPQALKVVIPPLISTYLSLMKDTSLGVAVAFPELYIISQTLMNQSGRAVQMMIIVMLVYLSISLFFSAILNWYNDRITLKER